MADMVKATGVIRLEPQGPGGAGLTRMALEPGDFQSALPEQHLHVFFENSDIGMTVGAWTTTDMQGAFGPYPDDAFMVVLVGRVCMQDGESNETPVEKGQSFFVRKSIPIS